MYFSSHSSDKQYFSSQKIDENVVFLATTHDKSGLTRRELPCVVTRNETLLGYRNCINFRDILIFSRSWYSWSRLSWCWEMVKPANLSGTPGDQGLHDPPYFPKILMHLKFQKRVRHHCLSDFFADKFGQNWFNRKCPNFIIHHLFITHHYPYFKDSFA